MYPKKQVLNTQRSDNKDYGLWEEEIKVLETIKSGKMKVTKEGGETFLEELRRLINESS